MPLLTEYKELTCWTKFIHMYLGHFT